ncbi:MAG: hypothetical protein QY323_01890 [Patescibacteria group bacterium]|nr:MAG: hypothetical protein QY323_01890 [Patescibacteria group bacterium]
MHLCETCRAEREWDTDESVRWQIAANLARSERDPAKARCAECTQIGSGAPTFIRNPLFQICRKCAERLDQCQHCRKPMSSSSVAGCGEVFETLFDAYVTLVKTYGRSTARTLLAAADLSSAEALHVPTLVELDVGLVDSMQPHQRYHYRLKRDIWTKVWGQLGFSVVPPRCEACPPPARAAPAMVRAAHCEHWTAGSSAVWCLPCAVLNRQCAICETSTE